MSNKTETTEPKFSPFTGTPEQVRDCVAVREACESAARILLTHCPNNTDRDAAIISLKDAMRNAIACLMINHR